MSFNSWPILPHFHPSLAVSWPFCSFFTFFCMHSGAIYRLFKQSIPWQVFSFYVAVFFTIFNYFVCFQQFFLIFLPFWSIVNLQKSDLYFYWLPSAAFVFVVLAHFMTKFDFLLLQIFKCCPILKKKRKRKKSHLTAFYSLKTFSV